MLEKVLNLKRVTQYGDVFMMDFDCDKCHEPNFSEKLTECSSCKKSFEGYQMDSSEATRRLVTGSARKYRFSKVTIQKIKKEQNDKCAYCFCDIATTYHVEHIRPLCVGGTNRKENIVLSCPQCNLIASSFVFL